MTKEQEKEQIYEVQPGNTLSQIALDNGLTVDGLVAINPSLESAESTIRVGDELIITVPEPELSVIHEELVYAEESYDAPVQYVDVDDWYTTKQEVVQEPSAGHRRVASVITYKNAEELGEEIILEEVDYEAVPKIVKEEPRCLLPISSRFPADAFLPISGAGALLPRAHPPITRESTGRRRWERRLWHLPAERLQGQAGAAVMVMWFISSMPTDGKPATDI